MSNKTEMYSFFPTPVQISEIAGGEALNGDLQRDIYSVMETTPNSLPEAWSCNLYTTISSDLDLLRFESFRQLEKAINDESTRFARALSYDVDKFPLRMTECWINVYRSGDAQEAHVHKNNVVSGIYYVKAPDGCGELLFHSPLADNMLEPPKTETTDFNTPAVGITPIAGQMLLFRSWLRHSVKPNRITEDRISIAFNLTM